MSLKLLMVEAEQKMHTTFDLLDAKYNRKFTRPASITWFQRGTKAGYASKSRNILGLHQGLLQTHTREIIDDTVPHEVCHLVAEQMWGGTPTVVWTRRGYRRKSNQVGHGAGWQRLMIEVGCKPERCHSMDVTPFAKRRERPYIYKCSCKEHAETSIIHTKIQRGRKYICRRCRTPLVFSHMAGKTPAPVRVMLPVAAQAPTQAPTPAMQSNGGERKSDIARRIIREQVAKGTSEQDIIKLIATTCNLSNSLAKTYYKNNLSKA